MLTPTPVRALQLSSFVVAMAAAACVVCAADGVPGKAEFAHGEWPFAPPRRPPVPPVQGAERAVNAIDAFVLDGLRGAGLTLNAAAERLTLLRRVTFDLTGLPPTTAEQAAFLADPSPAAYAKLVDRLLASPRHGERWAQHWLDVVRYAETEGFKADSLRPQAHRYRDYVIDSMSIDRPYDRFVRQQVAGDELEPENPIALIATGINRLYPDENNAANLIQRRQEILDDVTETTGLAFLGLTMGCAQCHDHKFDEIRQTDYFRLQAFFVPMVERDDLPLATAAEKDAYERRYAAWDEATRELRREIDELFRDEREKSREHSLSKFREEIQACVRKPASQRTPFEQQVALIALKQLEWRFDAKSALKKLSDEERQRYRELEKRLGEFEPLRPEPLATVMAVADVGRTAPPTHRLAGGSWRRPREEVDPGFPLFLGDLRPEDVRAGASAVARGSTTGRRSDLARWLTRPDHPLTARVIVNRLWHHHFGRGIVATPNDFGSQGARPTHPALLDWLAVELVDAGWSLKHMHRLMVTSATYRQSSRVDPESRTHARALEVDPENELLWRAHRRRLEGEAIRDALLHVAGELNLRPYGTSSRPQLPDGLSPRYAWKPDARSDDRNRRSIFVFAKRNLRFPLFDAFDQPDLHSSCGSRTATTTPAQALLMFNSDLTLHLARRWAERLMARFPSDAAGLAREAYRAALGRLPQAAEVAEACEFLGGLDLDSVSDFCHALYNSSEFVYID